VTSSDLSLELDANENETGAKIAEARRKAGLNQRALASRLGLSLWKLDQLEQGRGDSSKFRAAIEVATGQYPSVRTAPLAAIHPSAFARSADESSSGPHERSTRNLVLTGVAALVLIRFFTEVVHVAPRALNFIDIPIFLVFALAAASHSRRTHSASSTSFALPAFLFLLLCIVSVMLNPSRVEIGPVLVFLYGFLAPIGVYAAVYRLWPAGNARSLSRFLVGLGLVELLVVFLIDLPRFLANGNPDQVSGTFGTNAYQLVFFLLVFTGLLAGIFTHERSRLIARLAPLLFGLVLITVFLAQYRALLLTTGVSVIVIGLLLGSRGRGLVAAVIIVSSFGVTLSLVAKHFPRLKFASTIATLQHSPGSYVQARLHAANNVVQLYEDKPLSIAVGAGPGTFSSRAWQTFAQAASSSESNVQGKYVLALTGGTIYGTDVSDKYVLPELRTSAAVEGSTQLSSPFATYLAVPAEIGLPGLILILAIYGRATLNAARMTTRSLRSPRAGDSLPGLLIASTVAFTILLQMGLLSGNWFEVSRITFVSWTLFAVASKEFEARQSAAA
jgi:DNA-binding XRE family transcriptional regulator